MDYSMVVSTRDILLHHEKVFKALRKIIGWQTLFGSLLQHLSADVDTTPNGLYEYIRGWYDEGMSDCPADDTELHQIASFFSDLMVRLTASSKSLLLQIPNGFVYEVQIKRWVGLDLELMFLYTEPSYSVGKAFLQALT